MIEKLYEGPFFHGIKGELALGDMLSPGFESNFRSRGLNHIYFTATLDAAKWGAELAQGEGAERIYIVEPTGLYEADPNLTDKRFPRNPTRSYRSKSPLKVVAELGRWERHTDEEIDHMHEELAKLRKAGKDIIEDWWHHPLRRAMYMS